MHVFNIVQENCIKNCKNRSENLLAEKLTMSQAMANVYYIQLQILFDGVLHQYLTIKTLNYCDRGVKWHSRVFISLLKYHLKTSSERNEQKYLLANVQKLFNRHQTPKIVITFSSLSDVHI